MCYCSRQIISGKKINSRINENRRKKKGFNGRSVKIKKYKILWWIIKKEKGRLKKGKRKNLN